MTEPGPWTRSDLDEWRCPKCCAMAYTSASQGVLMLKCASCPGLVWMEQLFSMGPIDGQDDAGEERG